MSLWLCGHMISRDKIKTLNLHFCKTYKYQIWYSRGLCWGALTNKLKLYLNFHKTYKNQAWHSTYLGWGIPIYKPNMYLWSFGLVLSCYKIKMLYLHFHKTDKYQTWHSGDLVWGVTIFSHVIMWSHDVTR